jgi:ribonuclease Z
MKPSFHVRLLNSPFEDPSLYVRILRESHALIFDIGFTTGLSSRDILKINYVFVSHAHIDHFIGFDNILRTSLRKERPLKLFGPAGFIDCVEGKLRGYTWNLIRDYPLIIEVAEITEEFITKARFSADNSFDREDQGSKPFQGSIMKNAYCQVSAAILDHQIPCLAFSLEEDYHINIDKARLKELNLPVGPWLKDLKTAIRANQHNQVFDISGRQYSFSELKDIATISKGQKLSYVVDAVGSDENIEKIIGLVKGSDLLYIETYFAEKDKDRAIERYHLTAREAGKIARKAGVGRMEAIHFSPKYTNNPEELIREAKEEFKS